MISPAILACAPSGGPMPYHADAVHFDGDTFLSLASMTAANSGLITMSGFVKLVTPTPFGSQYPLCDLEPENYAFGLLISDNGRVDIALYNSDHSLSISGNTASGIFPFDNAWHSLIFSADTNQSIGLKRAAVYLDGVSILPAFSDSVAAFLVAFSGMAVGVTDTTADRPNFPVQELSNIMIWTGVSIVQADQTISPADIGNFVDGSNKPVDPATAIAAYGTPTIACIGNASAFGQPNLGSGGALALTGVPTNASTSPSD